MPAQPLSLGTLGPAGLIASAVDAAMTITTAARKNANADRRAIWAIVRTPVSILNRPLNKSVAASNITANNDEVSRK